MKRRILQAFGLLLAVAAAYFAFDYARGEFKTWYADNHMPRKTPEVATATPSQVCLTIAADPRTAISVQWRTSAEIADGQVEYVVEGATNEIFTAQATASELSDPMLKNDPVNRRFSARLDGLKPGTNYGYRVGSKEKNAWSTWSQFKTAPETAQDFSFGYMGDPQQGFDTWARVVKNCNTNYPDLSFYLIAGDLVDRGKYRDEWDVFFAASGGVFAQHPLVPLLGNHDYSSLDVPKFYLQLFTLPENGPKTLPAEYAYSFTYGNALFVVLDGNQDASAQAPWLEETLKNSNAKWKFAAYHQPAYSSSANRDNPDIRDVWGGLFDKYHVDIAFQGHDHAYLRTFPMKDGKKAASFAEGTVYLISVSGTKFYKQAKHDYTEVGFTDTPTYQVVNISSSPKDRLIYRAFDVDGKVKDEFTIEK